MSNFIKKYKYVIIIFLLALTIRIYKIDKIPWGFDGDEAAVGYYSYSLLTNLSDEYGNKLPLYFPSIGDYKYPGYSYLSTLPVYIFGLNVFSARLLSVVAGSALVVVVYLITKTIFDNETIAKISAFMTAISPYGIIFSRGAYESNVATFILALGILLLLMSQKDKRKKCLVFSAISFIVATFTYPSTRVFLILFLPLYYLIYIFRNNEKKVTKKLLAFFTFGFVAFVCLTLIDPRSRVRASDIGILKDKFASSYVNESIFEDGLAWNSRNLLLTRIYHNKVVGFAIGTTQRYLEHFDPNYLFVQGNPNMPKYSVPNFGLFYIFEFITVLVGIYGLSRVKRRVKYLVLLWIVLSVVPSALSIETPSPIRALIGLPSWIILSSFGVYYLSENVSGSVKKYYYALFLTISAFLFSFFWHQYSVHKLYHMPWYTDEGTKEMVLAVNKYKNNYEKVVVGRDPYIHFLFHNKITPQEFLKTANIESEKLGKWERVDSFGKFVFKMPYACPKIGREHVLYVCTGEDVPQNSEVLDVVYDKDGKPAYIFVEFVPFSQRRQANLPSRVHYMVDTDLRYEEALLPEDSGRYW